MQCGVAYGNFLFGKIFNRSYLFVGEIPRNLLMTRSYAFSWVHVTLAIVLNLFVLKIARTATGFVPFADNYFIRSDVNVLGAYVKSRFVLGNIEK